MTSRQVKKLMISRSAKGSYTAPEIRFDEYQSSRKMNLIMDRTLPFVLSVPPFQQFTFQCDFLRQSPKGIWDIDFEIDGDGHKEKWDHWKDAIKNESGLKVIHIPGEITKKRWWSYLDEQIPKALLSEQRSVYISG